MQSQPVVSLLFRSVALTDLLCTPAVPQPQVGGPSLLSFVNLDCFAMQHILFYVQTPEMSIAKKEDRDERERRERDQAGIGDALSCHHL